MNVSPMRGSDLRCEVILKIGRLLRRQRAKGYIVGGFLRDLLIERESPDLDIVVSGIEPEDVARYVHTELGFSRPAVFPRFKTALTAGKGIQIEICKLEGSLEHDAGRRDFTINCLYADITGLEGPQAAGDILDPTGTGVSDLKAGLLRTPADPCFILWLDPLRTLRAIRFHATLGFAVNADLVAAIPRMVYLLGMVSVERIRVELESILLSKRLRSSFALMHRVGVADIIIPELSRTHGFSQRTPHHAYDLFAHSIRTAANTPPDLTLRLSGLLHDTGKFDTCAEKSGRAVYYGHETVSAATAEAILKRLRFANRLTADVVFLVRNHMINYSEKWSDRAVRRFVKKMGPLLEQMLVLVEADRKAQRPERGMADNITDLRRRIKVLKQTDRIHLELPITGRDIMEILGVGEGPVVGRAKDFLSEEAAKRRKAMSKGECARLLSSWAIGKDLA